MLPFPTMPFDIPARVAGPARGSQPGNGEAGVQGGPLQLFGNILTESLAAHDPKAANDGVFGIDAGPELPFGVMALPLDAMFGNSDGAVSIVAQDANLMSARAESQMPGAAAVPDEASLIGIMETGLAAKGRLQSAAALPDGDYRIIDGKTTDGQLHLKVVSDDNPGRVLQVSLPVDDVMQLAADGRRAGTGTNAAASTGLSRVPLGIPGTMTTQFDRLVQQLNLTDLQVSTVATNTKSSDSGTGMVRLSFLPQDGSGAAVMQTVLPRQLLNITERPAGRSPGNTDPVLPENEAIEIGGRAVDSDAMIGRRVPQLLKLGEAADDVLQKQARFGAGAKSLFDLSVHTAEEGADANKIHASFGPTDIKAPEPSGDSIKVSPVRFALPDQIDMAQRIGHRAMMIRIEPEHLGPARLYLSSHHDVISARLIVDTPAAKAAVEGSLDQLANQLNKAGIKVDHFDVALSHGDTDDHTRERQAFWAARPRINQAGDDFFGGEYTDDIHPASVRAINTGYIRHDGVNVIA